jgi:hypothetical protein
MGESFARPADREAEVRPRNRQGGVARDCTVVARRPSLTQTVVVYDEDDITGTVTVQTDVADARRHSVVVTPPRSRCDAFVRCEQRDLPPLDLIPVMSRRRGTSESALLRRGRGSGTMIQASLPEDIDPLLACANRGEEET